MKKYRTYSSDDVLALNTFGQRCEEEIEELKALYRDSSISEIVFPSILYFGYWDAFKIFLDRLIIYRRVTVVDGAPEYSRITICPTYFCVSRKTMCELLEKSVLLYIKRRLERDQEQFRELLLNIELATKLLMD